MFDDLLVGITSSDVKYPTVEENPGFHPSEEYPEYPFKDISPIYNPIYESVRRLFKLLKLDEENYGTSSWNPLGELIKPGHSVVIKPNFVRHYHRLGKPVEAVITHASVLRPIMDYSFIALQGKGELIVADAPQGDANFDKIVEVNGTLHVFSFFKGQSSKDLVIELRDLRKEWTPYKYGIIWDRIKLVGDPRGYKTIVLDQDSEFIDKAHKNYYGADPDRSRTKTFHHERINRYNIAGTILNADVLISVPKLKVHRKVGVTLNIKNLVGINGEKNFLPHFTIGSPEQGGDEFSNSTWNNKFDRKLKDFLLWKHDSWGKYLYLGWHVLDKVIFRKLQKEQSFIKGDWYGNDTTWRAAVDLAKVVLYADKEGIMHNTPQRRYLSVIDGVIGGDKEGPLTPDPEYSGVILGGFNPATVDLFATQIMGYDWRKFKMLRGAVDLQNYRLMRSSVADICISTDIDHDFSKPMFHFDPPAGWVGHVEWEEDAEAWMIRPC